MKLSGMTAPSTLEVPNEKAYDTPSSQIVEPAMDTVKHACLQTLVALDSPVTTLKLRGFAPVKIVALKSVVPASIARKMLSVLVAVAISKIRLLFRTTEGEMRNQLQTEKSAGIYGDGIPKDWDADPLKTALNDALPNAPCACETGEDWDGTRAPVTLATSWSSWFWLKV